MAEILLVGAAKEIAAGVRSILRQDGHDVVWHRSTDGWRQRERETLPELVVAAVESPGALVPEAARAVRGFPAPLLLVQRAESGGREPFLKQRLVHWIASPFMSEELLGTVDALVRVRRVIRHEPTPDTSVLSEAGERPRRKWGSRLATVLGARIPKHEKPLAPYLEVASRVAAWADRRDAFEAGHAERVGGFCSMIADGLGLGVNETTTLLRAAMLHDIGKVAVPVEVLHQKQPLDPDQRRLIRTHPQRGAELLRALDPDEQVADAILYHHECPDGTGYYGRTAERTPRAAQVLAVAEVYDAMTSSQVKEPLSSEAALDQLAGHKGCMLDADCVEALVDALRPKPDVIPLSPMLP